MAWMKYIKKVSELRETNRQLDMDTMNRFLEILNGIKDQDQAISFNFLKEYLRLRPDDDDAMQELKIWMATMGDISYYSIIDDNDQKIYLAFTSFTEDNDDDDDD
ncbi:MAG: hypothetical protein RTU30_10305 [Candidatus Thorarchaeota archaeon]